MQLRSVFSRRLQTFQALEHPSFRQLWLVAWLWYTARFMEMVVLSWMVLDLTDSPFQVALVGVSRMSPMLLLGLVAGSLADRFPKMRVMWMVQVVNLAVTVSMALLIFVGVVQPWHAFLAVFLTGTSWTVDFAARRSYFSEIFTETSLANAISLDTAVLMGSGLVGPLLGGSLISFAGYTASYIVMAAMYGVVLFLLFSMRSPSTSQAPTQTSSVIVQVMEAARTIRENHTVRDAVLVTVVLNFFGFPYLMMVPVIAREVLAVGATLYGVLTAAAGLGSFLGALIIASLQVRRQSTLYSMGAMLMLAAAFLFALSTFYTLSLGLLFFAGLGVAGFATMQPTIVLQAVQPEMRGRAMGAVALGIGASPLGLLLLGQLASSIGTSMALALLTGTGFLVMNILYWRLPALRR